MARTSLDKINQIKGFSLSSFSWSLLNKKPKSKLSLFKGVIFFFLGNRFLSVGCRLHIYNSLN